MGRRPKGVPDDRERDPFLDAMGKKIKMARLRAGLTQKELAELLPSAQSWVYLAEDGQQNMHVSSLRKLASVLGVSVKDFIPDDTEAGPDPEITQVTREGLQSLVGQLQSLMGGVTDALNTVHRLDGLTYRQKSPGGAPVRPPKPDPSES